MTSREEGAATPLLPGKGRAVIGVDDLEQNLLVLNGILNGAGYSFFGVRSGVECLRLVHRVAPRLILLDIQMPDMDGFETCRRLRGIQALRRVPILFLTVERTPQALRAGLDAGANDFVVKPFDAAKLLERVNRWTARGITRA